MTIAVNPTGLELAAPNIIIGGNFDTNPWQRQVTFTNPATGVYTADRFCQEYIDDADANVIRTADAPTEAQAGIFSQYCFHVDVTTADAAIGAAQYRTVRYRVEGYDFAQIAQRPFTLSFWHKHTKTGTYCVAFTNNGSDRSYIIEYTQAVSDTWEYTSATVSASPSGGTWNYTNGIGLSIYFVLACGTDFHNTANTWNSTIDFATVNQVNALDSNTNNFKLALIKLEAGSVATPYPVELRADVMERCQRYYYKTYADGVYPAAVTTTGCVAATSSGTAGTGGGQNGVNMTVPFPVLMRANPTATIYNTGSGASGSWQSQSGGASVNGSAGYIGDAKVSAINTGACVDQTIYTCQVDCDAEYY